MSAPPDLPLLRPDWPAPAWVGAACSTREGGVSDAGYASLNLGDHVGDRSDAVAENRRRYAAALGVQPVFLQQVHGWDVAILAAHTPDGTLADAAITDTPQLACTVMVADCLPVLLCHTTRRRVAAVHAGWRGLVGESVHGVIEAAVLALRAGEAARHGDVVAWLGPCIGPTAFEVGHEVYHAFVQTDTLADGCFRATGTGKWTANLPALARRRLAALGIGSVWGHDGSAAWCTVSSAGRWFSHRGAGRGGRLAQAGRFAASVWIKD